MERITRFRAMVLILVFCLVLAAYAIHTYDLQIIQTGGNTDNATTFTTMTRVKAARGDILDRNGNVLVGNRASYDLVFNCFVIMNASGENEYLYNLVHLCRDRGIQYIEHFPISANRPFEYTLDTLSSSWQGYFQIYVADKDLDSDVTAPLLMKSLRRFYDIPEEWTDEDARAVIGLRYELALRTLTTLPNYVFLEDADDESLSRILELNVPGLRVEASTVREYTTSYAAHILGYVGKMTPEQWETLQDEGYSMDADVGQSGFEQAFEKELHGTDGWRVDEVTADGTVVSSYYEIEPKAGNNVEVTIDLPLQAVAEDAMAEFMTEVTEIGKDGSDIEGGAVVVMEVGTGRVLACASFPTYDPRTFNEKYDEILKQDYNPLINRALEMTYPPGSTFKMVTTIAAINNHYIDHTTKIQDLGVFEYEGLRLNCMIYTDTGGTHGAIDVTRALAVSCNYFFYELGRQMTIEQMDEVAKGLGLGEATGVELYEELGHRANPASKAEIYAGMGDDELFYGGDRVQAAIGQSVNFYTPMQLAVYVSTLATRGVRYKATFLNRVVSTDYRTLLVDNQPEIVSQMFISDESFYSYKTGMELAASDFSGGTVSDTFGWYDIQIAAKSGTAQHGSGGSDNGAFICFAPSDNPRIAIAVYGERAAHGSSLAKIGKAILDAYFSVDEVGQTVYYENTAG